MIRRSLVALVCCLVLVPAPSGATTSRSTGSSHGASTHRNSKTTKASTAKKAAPSAKPKSQTASKEASKEKAPATVARDSHGRILRSEEAKRSFEASTGYPHGRRGYVVDHIVPLACGGADDTSNMQWQTIADGKAKDKWERAGCK
jgi:hypothetical protein